MPCLDPHFLVQNGGNDEDWRFFTAYRVSSDLDGAIAFLTLLGCLGDISSDGGHIVAGSEGLGG